jgi:hypothetical protein
MRKKMNLRLLYPKLLPLIQEEDNPRSEVVAAIGFHLIFHQSIFKAIILIT